MDPSAKPGSNDRIRARLTVAHMSVDDKRLAAYHSRHDIIPVFASDICVATGCPVLEKSSGKRVGGMAFICTNYRCADDRERFIRIHLVKVAGTHIFRGDENKWKVFLRYERPDLQFSSMYYVKWFRPKYIDGRGEEGTGAYVERAVFAKHSIASGYSHSARSKIQRPPDSGEIDQLYCDIREANIAWQRFRTKGLSRFVQVPDPDIVFAERFTSDDQVDALLDGQTPETR